MDTKGRLPRGILLVPLLLSLLLTAVGCTQAGRGQPDPRTDPPSEVRIVEGTLVGIGPSMVILTADEELTLPVADNWRLTRDGQPMDGLDLRANVQVRVTVEAGRITHLDVMQ